MNTQKELVSVITMTRNRALVLGRAINSVLHQDYSNFEYIIIDGASEDNTLEVVSTFKDSRINFIRLETNLPISETMDIAFSASKGRYITFLDDDDEYLPSKIRKQVELISRLPEEYGFVYCWMDYYDDKSNNLVKKWHPKNRGNAFLKQIEKQSVGGTPTLFLRREAYVKTGGWHKKLRNITDYEFSTRLTKYYLTDYVPEVLVKVHVNHGYEQMSDETYDEKRIKKFIEFHHYYLTEYKDIYEKHPSLQSDHFNSLARLYFRSKDVKRGQNYLIKLFKIKPLDKKTYLTIFKCILFLYNKAS